MFWNPIRNAADFLENRWWPAYRREKQRWLSINRPCSGIKVFYGYDNLSAAIRENGGGLIKCQDLVREFPNTTVQPNILYLVSSGLPRVGPGFAGLILPELHNFMTQFARRAGTKVIINQDGVAYPGWHGRGWRRINRSSRQLIQYADYVFYQSRFSKMSSDLFLGERKGPFEILYNAVDTGRFTPGPTPKSGHPLTLLVTGTHYGFYRVKSTIDALALLRSRGIDCRLKIAGRFRWMSSEEACLQQVKNSAADQNVALCVEYAGPYSQDEANDLFRSANILVHAKYNDPCPRVVVEAMACGLPVVYSATGGTPELVGEDAGVGIPAPLDWEKDHPPAGPELANAIIHIIDNYEKYALAARRRAVARFDLQPWLARHREVFEGLCS